MAVVARDLNVDIEAPLEDIALNRALIYKSKGGDVEDSGTWVHRRVALRLAAWLNEEFESWVFGCIEELLMTGKVELDEEKLKGLSKALSVEKAKSDELDKELAVLEHRYNQALYQLDSAGLIEEESQESSIYGSDWAIDVDEEE